MRHEHEKYRPRAGAVERNASQSGAWWRFARSIGLGTIALTLGVIWVGEQYGVARSEVLEFLGLGLFFVAVLVLAALIFAACAIALRRWLKK